SCGGAGALDLRPDFGNLDLPDQIRLVLAAWLGPLPRLLVFDNCEDEALLVKWRPPSGGSHVLVTSRRTSWSAGLGVRLRPLGKLSTAESVALLCKHRPDLLAADHVLREIAEELGRLPLALHLAGCYLARYRHASFATPAAYLAALRGPDLLKHASLTGGDWSPTGHEQHVARTFALSHQRLRPGDAADDAGRQLLMRAACFAAGEALPRHLLTRSLRPGPEDGAGRREDAIARLADLGLIEQQQNGTLVLHRLLAAFVVHGSPESDLGEALTAVESTLAAEAQRLHDAGLLSSLLEWQPHLRHVAARAAT